MKGKRCVPSALHGGIAKVDKHASLQDGAKMDDMLVRLMQQDAVIRKVLLTYALQRITLGDLISAEPLLLAAKEVRASWLLCLRASPAAHA